MPKCLEALKVSCIIFFFNAMTHCTSHSSSAAWHLRPREIQRQFSGVKGAYHAHASGWSPTLGLQRKSNSAFAARTQTCHVLAGLDHGNVGIVNNLGRLLYDAAGITYISYLPS
jgi:hypothetical protein